MRPSAIRLAAILITTFAPQTAVAQIRLEVFNVLNRANFATPTRPVFAGATQNEAPLATAGKVTRTVNSSRQVQLGAKILF